MKNRFLIFSILAISLLMFSSFNTVFAERIEEVTKIYVPTYEVAIEIAKIVCKAVYPDREFDFDNGSCLYNKNDEWEIIFEPIEGVLMDNNNPYLGGGHAVIRIKRINAEITYIFLQK